MTKPWTFIAPSPGAPVTPGRAPTFSVIVAAYNVADLIGEALDSALRQTVPAHEVIVCDDGSTDDLEGAIAPYRDRIVFLRRAHGGEAVTKNEAAAAATGEFVVILDGDDVDEPHRLEALGALAAARPDLDLLTSDAYVVEDGRRVGRLYHEGHRFETDDQRAEILRRNWVFNPAARRVRWLEVGGFDPAFPSASDWEFEIRMVLSGSSVGMVGEPLASYRSRPGRLSSDRVTMLTSRVRALEKTQATMTNLSAPERQVLSESVRTARVRLSHEAIRAGHPSARAAAAAVARTEGITPRTRARAAVAAMAPGVARRLMR
jgi:cellulose synthase/poly-beta-1,6-N-acetylglucosamine synthase-like glycosyltransferase